MRKILTLAVMAVSFPLGVLAQERGGDAALGALSGAVVLGPVGAVAGAVVGYAAGPSIARSWGLRRSQPRLQRQSARRSINAAPTQGKTPGVAPQGTSVHEAATPSGAREMSLPATSAQPAGGLSAMSPVQGFE